MKACLRARMQDWLEDNNRTLSLTSTALKLAGLAPSRCYREQELREALKAIYQREVFTPLAEERYGPPAKTYP